jgi:hypothetical protein
LHQFIEVGFCLRIADFLHLKLLLLCLLSLVGASLEMRFHDILKDILLIVHAVPPQYLVDKHFLRCVYLLQMFIPFPLLLKCCLLRVLFYLGAIEEVHVLVKELLCLLLGLFVLPRYFHDRWCKGE